jgi:hypothetical protein
MGTRLIGKLSVMWAASGIATHFPRYMCQMQLAAGTISENGSWGGDLYILWWRVMRL